MSTVVTLIGYRGSGKSSVAKPLADRLRWRAVDADGEIERRAGKPIADIFAEDGESTFRELERQVMADLLGESQIVIAAGGGAVISEPTRRAIRDAGPVVWLQASVELLEQRILGDASSSQRRPNLTSEGGRAEIERLLAEREPLYRQSATLTVDTTGKTISDIVEEILDSLGPAVFGER